jgi:hypothetical protein
MTTHYTIIATTNDDAASLRNRLDKTGRRVQLSRAISFLRQILGGNKAAQIRTQISTGKASFTYTCSQAAAVDNTDTVSIGAVTLAVKAAPATENEFLKGASDIALAANLAAAINAHSVLSEFCTAVSDGISLVTVTIDIPGAIGNQLVVAEAGSGFTKSGAAPTGGASDEMDEFAFGIAL